MFRLIAIGLLLNPLSVTGISTSFTVRENAGALDRTLLSNYPVSVVVPFGKGHVQDESTLRIVEGIPMQVEVLERWFHDKSLRHALVHFQVSFDGPYQEKTFHISDEESSTSLQIDRPVTIETQASYVQVDTGKIRFQVKTISSFNLIDKLWRDENGNGIYEDSELIVASNERNGANLLFYTGQRQYDSDRADFIVSVEESGPLRAVIRVEAPTLFVSENDHLHGFAVRLYAYAGHDFVKVDYQLQNSARVKRSWPLYFQEMTIDLQLQMNGQSPAVIFGLVDGTTYTASFVPCRVAQELNTRYTVYQDSTQVLDRTDLDYENIKGQTGYMHVQSGNRGVTTVVRNFWQKWPNGLVVNSENKITMELFPEWSAQWADGVISDTGLYWLQDMQHVYKEILLVFHATSPGNSAVKALANTFQYHPTVQIPTEWYRETRATLDMGGLLPQVASQPTSDTITPDSYWLKYNDPQYRFNITGNNYAANWINFGDVELASRARPCTTGGFPYAAEQLVSSGYSAHYFLYELWGIGEMNVRPQWLAGFLYNTDQQNFQLTENPYCGGTWRVFEGHSVSPYCCDFLPGTEGTQPTYGARDDQHGWFYHVADSYFYTGNYWIRDWYTFVVQFRSVRLASGDPFLDRSSRATGHAIAHALQAARVAEDGEILTKFANYFRNELRPNQDSRYGSEFNENSSSLGGGFQTGYLLRAVINFMEFAKAVDVQLHAELFQYVSGIIEWNLHHGNFPYYHNHLETAQDGSSSGTAMTMIDPQAWYFLHTGKQVYLDHIDDYMMEGLNGGERPYGAPWTSYNGSGDLNKMVRTYLYAKQVLRTGSAPNKITDLAAFKQPRASDITLQWTGPENAARYHVVWSSKPIVEEHSTDESVSNWWAANTAGTTKIPRPGAVESMSINTGGEMGLYFAVFSFDTENNMSEISNVAIATNGPVPPTPPTMQQSPTPRPTQAPVLVPTPTLGSSENMLLATSLDGSSSISSPEIGRGGTTSLTDNEFVLARTNLGARFSSSASGQTIVFPAGSNINLNQGYAQFWYAPNYDAGADDLIHNLLVVGDIYNPPSLVLSESDSLLLRITTDDWTAYVTQSPWRAALWNQGHWVEIRAEWDSASGVDDSLRIFVNGQRVDEGNVAGGWDISGASPIFIGSSNGAGEFPADGIIDDLQIAETSSVAVPAPPPTVTQPEPTKTETLRPTSFPPPMSQTPTPQPRTSVPTTPPTTADPTSLPAPPPPSTNPVESSPSNAKDLFPGESFEEAVESLQPGDTLIVHGGDYFDTRRISIRVKGGSEQNRVTIMGAPDEARPRIMRSSGANPQNTINIEGANFLTIKGLEIMSNGGDGVRLFEPGVNTDIVLEDLVIHGVAVGINVQADSARVTIRRNHIYDTAVNGATGAVMPESSGEGMYLGCHTGSCTLSDSLIENNWVHDTQAGTQGDGIELKRDSFGNLIRNNIIHDTKFPCLLLYGAAGRKRNVVEGNAVWNCQEGGIQVAAEAIVRNNVVFNSGIGLNSRPHNGVNPGSLEIVHNTIVNADKCLNIRGWDSTAGIVFGNNAIYCSSDTLDLQGGSSGVIMTGNVVYPGGSQLPTGSYVVGAGIDADFEDASNRLFYPSPNGALVNIADDSIAVNVDFDSNARPSGLADVGAYEKGSGPSCKIEDGFKALCQRPAFASLEP